MKGAILYTCGHEIYDPENPQDMEWKSGMPWIAGRCYCAEREPGEEKEK